MALPDAAATPPSPECCPTPSGSGIDGLGEMTSPLSGLSRVDGPISQGPVHALDGRDLPGEFNVGHFLDPAFMSGLVNELYAEDRPRMPASPPANRGGPELNPMSEAVAALIQGSYDQFMPRVPGMGQPPTPEAIDFADPRVFLGAADTLPGPGMPGPTPAPAATPGDGYYFLAPAAPAERVVPTTNLTSRGFHVEAIRQDFPILQQRVHGKPLIWLDNAATTQKPQAVIDALSRFYEHDNSNIHRAAHTLAARATNAYEGAREKVRRFLGASAVEEIVFVRGATEAVNLVAQTYGRQNILKGDEIVLTTIEHHANIVPWQFLAQEKGAVLKVAPVNDRGEVILEEYEKLLGPRTKLVAITHVSNALGTVNPVRTMTQLAHRTGARVLIDGAQSAPHMSVDVQTIDCDFYVIAGHKIFGPTGIGALYGRRALLESMPPWQGGGNMIDQVTFEQTTFQPAPAKFEAGTGILAAAVGLGAAIDYLEELGMENIHRYEHGLLEYATAGLASIPGLRMIGTAAEKASVLSFVLEGVRTEDLGRYLDHEGIAVRAGHHCAQPTMRRFGVTSTVRPSLAFYNTPAEIDVLVAAVRKARHSLA